MGTKFHLIILSFCLLLLVKNPVFSQEANQNANWVRVQSENGEFSIEMPKNLTYFYDKDGFYDTLAKPPPLESLSLHYSEVQMLTAYDNKTVMRVEIYKVILPEKGIDNLLDKQDSKTSRLKDLPEDFVGKQSEKSTVKDFSTQKDFEVSYVSRIVASKTHIYVITAINRGAKTSSFERFLSSIRFWKNQTGNTTISSLKPLTIEEMGVNETDQAIPLALPNQDKSKETLNNLTKLLILTLSRAGYTEAAKRNPTSGIVRLRLTFEKDGSISKIGIISGLDNGLTRNAFFAALRIKFIPQEKNGIPEAVTKPVEFSFKIF